MRNFHMLNMQIHTYPCAGKFEKRKFYFPATKLIDSSTRLFPRLGVSELLVLLTKFRHFNPSIV